MKDELLNLPTCASRLGVPVKWLKDAAKAGLVPCLRVDKRKLRFEVNAVKAAMAKMAAQGSQKNRKRQTFLTGGLLE